MGCSTINTVREDINLRQKMIILNLNTKYHKNELEHAQSLIKLISKIRNKTIYLYHKLIYDTGACLFVNPSIVHCFKAVLIKISSEFEGKAENCEIKYIEEPPFLKVVQTNVQKITLNLINELFNYIVELKSYKTIIKQIDKETPGLLYLTCENKENISSENINKINEGIELFKDMIKIREDILIMYTTQVREFITRQDIYLKEINLIGDKAYQEKITDIYEILFLRNKIITEDEKEYHMYKSINEAKRNMEKILKQEKNDDIINESIIEPENDF